MAFQSGAFQSSGWQVDGGILPPPIIIRRGDDANHGARERFWASWRAEKAALIEIVEYVKKPKAEKSHPFEFHLEPDFVTIEIPSVRKALSALTAPLPDYTAIAAIASARIEAIEKDLTARRRKRDMEAVLLLS